MKTTTNTTSTKKLVAVWAANHAFVNGERFDNVSPIEVQAFVESISGQPCNVHLTNDGIVYTVEDLATVTPVAETVTVETMRHVPSSIAVNPHDARMMHRLDADILASRYGVNRIKQRAMFTVGNDKDAERAYIYRAIDSGTPYVLYHGELLAIPESAIMPNNGAVMVSHVEPKPKQDTPKQDTRKRRHDWVVFRYGGNVYARKINRSGDALTVNHDRNVWPIDALDCVSRHYTKEAAQKRVKQERKNDKHAKKLTTKPETTTNGNGCKHIPETYNGLVVDVQNGNIENIDRKTAWNDVKELVDELVAAGIKLDCVTYERDYAWVIPSNRSDKFARDNHMVVSMTTKRGHSLKDRRRAWFVKCTK